MLKMEVIGNLGADAEIRSYNGRNFLSFRIAHSEKYTNQQTGEIVNSSTWVSCTMNAGFERLMPYLKKGVKVYVRGNINLKIFDSALTHQKEVGINLSVWELELCGNKTDVDNERNRQQIPEDSGKPESNSEKEA